MKELYIDIMEKALSAYTDERIIEYINEVKKNGLTEHGFPRLAANIGILIAHGRCLEKIPIFIELMDISCEQMIKVKAANNFSVREVCMCIAELEKSKAVDKEKLCQWKAQITSFEPWKLYNSIPETPTSYVHNWSIFSSLSELLRHNILGTEAEDFIDWNLASQFNNIDEFGMYKDPNNPIMYDFVGRMLLGALVHFGYRGKYAQKINEILDKVDEITLKLQSVSGEISFGGRSNQMTLCEPLFAAYCEMAAVRHKKKGDLYLAGQFKAAAELAVKHTFLCFEKFPFSHVKNRYGADYGIGCENYAYFNKYMITIASNIYMAYAMADDSIVPTEVPANKGGYLLKTSQDFHKVIMSNGGYTAQFDTNADFAYDANGLGRVQKADCSSIICLSVPFPSENANYKLPKPNKRGMSICSFSGDDFGSHGNLKLLDFSESEEKVTAKFQNTLNNGEVIIENYSLTSNGLDIEISGNANAGIMIPVLDFDGQKNSKVIMEENSISIEYEGSVCKNIFDGVIEGDFEIYHNRNGRYRLYKMYGKNLHIEIEKL